MKKTRLDLHLAQKELSVSRERAKREIIAGWVKVDGETVREPSRKITGSETISIQRPGGVFVSRGGEKLEKALDSFFIDVTGLIAADLGASTGGFTDCLIKRGAAFVYAIDVGYGQLDYSLRSDNRVKPIEKFNVRNLTPDIFDRKVDFITADLSFISILKTADPIAKTFPGSFGVFLVKPQFEALKSEHKKGVVKDPDCHVSILTRVIKGLSDVGYFPLGLTWSPVKGPAGNIEYLLYFKIGESTSCREIDFDIECTVNSVVENSHLELNTPAVKP